GAGRRQRVGSYRTALRHARARRSVPARSAVGRPRAGRRSRGVVPPPARVGARPDAGEEAAEVQPHALGRDRTRRHRHQHGVLAGGEGAASDEDWRELCELWSSDYRTHITEARWAGYRDRLARIAPPPAGRSAEAFALRREAEGTRTRRSSDERNSDVARRLQPSVERDGFLITLEPAGVPLVLNARRGLAIHALGFAAAGGDRLCGTLTHGFYDDIHWGADFYSGMVVFESPGHPKLTDLNRVEPAVHQDDDGSVVAEATQATDLGPMTKTIRVTASTVEVTYRFDWGEVPVGSLRLGDVTLQP